MFQMSKHNVVS